MRSVSPARGYWVIRFDNRDIGKSSAIDPPAGGPAPSFPAPSSQAPVAAPYLLKDMAADAIGLMDFLHIERAHVVGASMGGMIAQEMAIRWPMRVLSLTSIMSTTGEPGLPPPDPKILAVFQAPPPRTPEDYIEANVSAWRLLRGPGYPEEEARDRRRAERAARRGLCPEGGIRQMQAILASGGRKAALAGVKAPTLVIHGADDPLVPLAAGEDTARAIPGARLAVFERMGHALPMTVWPRLIDEIATIARA